ncbi:MAG: hypothetical protein M1817_002125 [Caeruleum heppii]|nr:MAG: hypothetical protein M1817_002125 [Caeruleum heppii]
MQFPSMTGAVAAIILAHCAGTMAAPAITPSQASVDSPGTLVATQFIADGDCPTGAETSPLVFHDSANGGTGPLYIYDRAMTGLTDLLNMGLLEVGYRTPVRDPAGGPDFFALFTARVVPDSKKGKKIGPWTVGINYGASIMHNCTSDLGFGWLKPTAANDWQRPRPSLTAVDYDLPVEFGFQSSKTESELPCNAGSCNNANPTMVPSATA